MSLPDINGLDALLAGLLVVSEALGLHPGAKAKSIIQLVGGLLKLIKK